MGFFRLDRKAGASSCYYVWRCGGHGWVASFHVNIRIRFFFFFFLGGLVGPQMFGN